MLINLRNALMAGNRLPYDAEVEYIRGTGTQYINSGLTVSNAIRVKCRVSVEGVCWIFGGRTGGNNKQFSVYQQASTNIRFGYANTAVDKTDSYGVHDIDFNQNAVYFDGTLVHTFAASTFSSASPLYIGTLSIDEQGNPAAQCLIGNIYAFQVYVDGTLVRDFIPVRKGTVGYLYDRVSGKLFGNAGTGDFVLGPDVVPVEYIESTGTQYINTGLKYFPDFDVSIEVPSGQRNATIYCDATHTLERIGSSTPYWQIYAGDRLQSSVSVYGFHRVQFKASSLTIDGQAIGTISNRTWADGATCYIGFNGNNIYVYKLYGCQMWDINNNATRNYKPIRVGTGSTWEGAMMDVLTRRVYRNAGTGAFGYGNDLKYPIPAS